MMPDESIMSAGVGASTAEALDGRPLVSRGRTMLVHGSLVAFALAILAQAVQVQLVDRQKWSNAAAAQHVRRQDVAPLRGRILDATGAVLVESRELVRLGVSPKALDSTKRYGDARVVLKRELQALRVSPPLVRRALDTTLAWVTIPGLYAPSDVEKLVRLRAVRRTSELRRFGMAAPIGIQRVLGTVNDAQQAQGGIELEFDELLRGVSGRDEFMKDGRGNPIESPALSRVEARPGHSITLTLNRSLQEICERELALAMERTGASGGDVVMLDPRDGSVLALAGSRDGRPAANSTPLTEPYEPGSVIKPFVVARLLDAKRTTPDEIINTEGGKWREAERDIFDEHKRASMPVRDVIRLSSNIGVAKLSQRLSAREEYEALRDFGFGALTGVPYPAESRGALPLPANKIWRAQTPASLAMGYAMSATPLQIAVAYAAIANGGELLQPVLVREIHDAEGALVYRHQKRLVRRALSETTANTMRTILASVVDSGTATAAQLETYDVGGKSGTARRTVGKRYGNGTYNATFAALFPAQAPQYVIVAKLIDPQSKIFGGAVSGSLVHGILQAALPTLDASLDRGQLARYAKPMPLRVEKPRSPQAIAAAARDSQRFDSLRAPAPAAAPPMPAAGRVVVSLPFVGTSTGAGTGTSTGVASSERVNVNGKDEAKLGAARSETARSATEAPDDAAAGDLSSTRRVVPSVFGLNTRQAARTLFAAGFQVTLAKGAPGQTRPAAGTAARVGSTVVLSAP
jgi:cell division protein FtsI (penicillin-binding protein 3)